MRYSYCNSIFNYNRATTHQVNIKDVKIGSGRDIVIQSMGVVSSLDTPRAVKEAKRIIDAGGEMVRFTAASVAEASGVGDIKDSLNSMGYYAPVIADVHFNPEAAFVAATRCDKVRINPGNFIDKRATFTGVELSEEEYNAELERIEVSMNRLIGICLEHGTALRIGVNHGSLSDRIMSRYGNTPEGMVTSAMEFLRVCHSRRFMDVVVSMKSSTTPVMVRAYRLLAAAMRREGFSYPLHLGVTEAGEGGDGRIRSSVGIGALLADGLGDTIRVSLTEPPENEIAVARQLISHYSTLGDHSLVEECDTKEYHPYNYQKWQTSSVGGVGGDSVPVVVGYDIAADSDSLFRITREDITPELISSLKEDQILVIGSKNRNQVADIRAAILSLREAGVRLPIIANLKYKDTTLEDLMVFASADSGIFFIDSLANGLWIEAEGVCAKDIVDLSLSILQSAGARISRTEYISCPGCGRTLFDIQSRVKEVKEQTKELTGLKIAVMGCIVNGPGEMADANYGYIGAGRGKVSLYKDGEAVVKGIDEADALEQLIKMIKDNGDWR